MTSTDPTPDPRRRHDQPDPVGEQQDHPGHTTEMAQQPDHGEESYQGTGRLEGKRVLITGADSGIGRAVAIAYAREGADLVLSYLEEETDDARETARWVEQAGRRAVLCPGDITQEVMCDRLITVVLGELGGLDVLVNNAAYQMVQPGGIVDISTEQFDRVLKTNLYAMFWLCRGAVPHLRPGSSIINTASIQGVQPSPDLLDYATTKAGIINFTRALGQELAEKGHPGQRRRPGPDLDSAHPGDDAVRTGGVPR